MASTSGRPDGRGTEEFRSNCKMSLMCKDEDMDLMSLFSGAVINTKVISQARGSSYAEFDKTKIMAGM